METKKKTNFFDEFSILSNVFLALVKFIMACFFGVFFFVSGVVNLFFALAKWECSRGINNKSRLSFNKSNLLIGICVVVAGLQYFVYMLTLLLSKRVVIKYGIILGIAIAFVSFVEFGMAIYGLFKIKNNGHYFRALKVISLCTALTAIVWTELALLSFTYDGDCRIICGASGVAVGLIIALIGVYLILAPKLSIVDREHQIYFAVVKNGENKEQKLQLKIINSKIYGDYVFDANMSGGVVEGEIKKTNSHIKEFHVALKIVLALLSEILIFVYLIGGLIYFIRSTLVFKKLDKIMHEMGYEKKQG